VKQTRYKLIEFEGAYYFINDGDKIVKGGNIYIPEKFLNGTLLPNGKPFTVGLYKFDSEGKMINVPA
jgi:hypothetical protein